MSKVKFTVTDLDDGSNIKIMRVDAADKLPIEIAVLNAENPSVELEIDMQTSYQISD
jgi:hypothetical protein